MADYLGEKLLLKDDPFKIGAPETPEIWASSEETKKDLEKIVGNMLVSESSTLGIIWGELGTGKTYAANYFIHKGTEDLVASLQTDKVLSKDFEVLSFPRVVTAVGGRRDVQFLDKIMETIGLSLRKNPRAKEIFTKAFKEGKKDEYVKSVIQSLSISFEIQTMLESNVSADEFFKGISEQRLPGETEVDLTRLPYFLDVFTFTTKILTHPEFGIDRAFLWIDEVERFEDMPIVERTINNTFLRDCVDRIQEKLAMFLCITTARPDVSDLKAFLFQPIMNRVTYFYQMKLLTDESFAKSYVRKLLESFRTKKADIEPYYPFAEKCVEQIIRRGRNKFEALSPRAINIEFEKALASLRREQLEISPEKPIDFETLKKVMTPL
jgi:hypothetical protein